MLAKHLPARPIDHSQAKAMAWIVVITLAGLLWYGQDLVDWYAGAPQGQELLFCAAGNGTADDIDRALSQGADINGRGTTDATPLMIAADARNPASVRALLERHADPNLVACTGVTALYNAVIADDPETIELLIAAGASPNNRVCGETALDTALRVNHQDSIRILRRLGAVQTR
jgi:ankyrin repeat protein